MFAGDNVLCDESWEEVDVELERWRYTLDRKGRMQVNRSKTEYLCVNEGYCGRSEASRCRGGECR